MVESCEGGQEQDRRMEAEVDKQMVDQGRKGWSANDSVKYTTRDKTYLFLPRLLRGCQRGQPLGLSLSLLPSLPVVVMIQQRNNKYRQKVEHQQVSSWNVPPSPFSPCPPCRPAPSAHLNTDKEANNMHRREISMYH